MFPNARGISFYDSHFAGRDVNIFNQSNNITGKPILEILYEQAAPGGFHASNERYDPPKCHKDTRLTIRQDLLDQVVTAVVSCILWLYGAAGAGKSAIAQSFAETCQEKGLLIGTFFFFRTAPLRNNADRLAASLSYQLAGSIPSTLYYIAHCIATHPAIFVSSLEDQLERLFVQPLRRACEEDPTLLDSGPRLVILDGLDECDTAEVQQSIAILIALEKVLENTPIPIVVLVASRPEIHISSAFNSLDRRGSVEIFRFGLNDSDDIKEDIRLYLNDKFSEIKRDHHFKNYLPGNWPLLENVESIVEKSSGQFIYAATIIRYVGHHRCKPHERLKIALYSRQRYESTVGNSPFKELDALYHQILSGLEDVVMTLCILHLALNLSLDGAQCPKTIASRLGLGVGDVELNLSNLASLMKYEGEVEPIRFFHTSLRDFLEDERRSRSLHISQPAVHTALSKAYLHHCRNLGSVLSPAFHSTYRHLPVAEPDQELSVLVDEFSSKLPKFIMKKVFLPSYLPAQQMHRWFDREHSQDRGFANFIDKVYDLRQTIELYTGHSGFWDRCLDGIHLVFYEELQVYLTDDSTHDFLVLAAFSVDNHLPRFPFALHLGMLESAWSMCYKNDIFNLNRQPTPLWGISRTVLQNFLLDPHLAGEFYVTSEHFIRVALKCLKVIMDTRLFRDIRAGIGCLDDLHDQEECYLQAVRSIPGAPEGVSI